MKHDTYQHVQQLQQATQITLEKIRKSPGYAEVASEFEHEYEVERAQMSIGSPQSRPPTPSFQHSSIPLFHS
jgi:hypothetical protein